VISRIREMMLRDVALRYSGYFAKANLGTQRSQLLLDLLVHQRMAGLEASLQKGPSGGDRQGADLRMIRDLVGEDGYRDLEDSGRAYAAAQTAAETLKAVEATAGPVAAAARPGIEAALATIDMAAGTGDYIKSGAELTQQVQQEVRARQSAALRAALGQVGSSLNAAQQQALTAYVNEKTETSIEFAVMMWKANHPKGYGIPPSY
jgi:hypothetical protein